MDRRPRERKGVEVRSCVIVIYTEICSTIKVVLVSHSKDFLLTIDY